MTSPRAMKATTIPNHVKSMAELTSKMGSGALGREARGNPSSGALIVPALANAARDGVDAAFSADRSIANFNPGRDHQDPPDQNQRVEDQPSQ